MDNIIEARELQIERKHFLGGAPGCPRAPAPTA